MNRDTKTELHLVEQLKMRRAEAIEFVVRQYTQHLYKACIGMGLKPVDADDLVQSTWLIFFDAIQTFEMRSSLRTYIFGILYNKIREQFKKNMKWEPREDIEELLDSHFDEKGHWHLAQSPVDPIRFAEGLQTLDIIEKCLALLPQIQRQAFHLKEILEEESEEICNILNISISNFHVLLFRARVQLRECVENKIRLRG